MDDRGQMTSDGNSSHDPYSQELNIMEKWRFPQ